jgi:hypothetical protein
MFRLSGVCRLVLTSALTATGVAGLGVTAPSVSADTGCPAAAPVSAAVAGAALHGLTVSSGTDPEPFTGSVIGVLKDGIAPGLDLIMANLDSPELERVGGIWAGMSGSPVYTEDGSLLGAVSYGLSVGPSQVAGITPASEMYALLDSGAPAAGASTRVPLSSTMQQRLVASGYATTQQADSGLRRLPIPLAISGLSPERRADSRVMSRLAPTGTIPYAAASASVSGASSTDPGATIVAGSNLAAGISYGDLSAMAVGTATAVCGNQVLGFGHPFLFNGATTESMHGADALYVQDDPAGTPFKLANPTGPIGTIVQDRLAGIVGTTASTPATIGVTSSITSQGRSRDGRTDVVLPDYLSDIAAFHLLANEDRVFDEIGGGVSTYTTTITGTHSDGSPWTFSRSDRAADPSDLSFGTVFPVDDDISALQYSGFDGIHIDSVDVKSDMSPGYTDYEVRGLRYRAPDGTWRTPTRLHPARVREGDRLRLLVHLVGYNNSADVQVPLNFTVPARTAGSQGYLQVSGGGVSQTDFLDGAAPSSKTFDGLIQDLESAPRQDQLVTTMLLGPSLAPGPKGVGPSPVRSVERRTQLDRVVFGGRAVPVRVIPAATARPGVVAGHRWTLSAGFVTGAPHVSFRFPGSGTPLMGDFDGNGDSTPATFADGVWTIQPSSSSPATTTVSFGAAGDQPVVGDWNGDGNDDIGVLHGDTFSLLLGLDPAGPTLTVTLPAGVTGIPVAGDWNGDGIDTVGVFKHGTWTVLQRNKTGAATRTAQFGAVHGRPVVGDWNGDGLTGIATVHNGVWAIRQRLSSGTAVRTFTFGAADAMPISWR